MSVTVTLHIPEATARQAQKIAASTRRRVEDVLAEWIDRAANEIPVDQLPDDDVRLLAAMQLSEVQQAELDDLLDRQRENTLSAAQRARLETLMQAYRSGLVRKAEAIKVAVERGLMQPLSPTPPR